MKGQDDASQGKKIRALFKKSLIEALSLQPGYGKFSEGIKGCHKSCEKQIGRLPSFEK